VGVLRELGRDVSERKKERNMTMGGLERVRCECYVKWGRERMKE